MVETKKGGEKGVKTMKERYGDDVYRKLGRRGGQNGHTGGFAANPALAKIVGAKGGRCSVRRPKDECDKEWNDNKDKIMRMYYEGYTVKDIANTLNLNYFSISRKIRKVLEDE